MTGRGSRMSPKERYLRSVYLNYQVCTDVVRHYFDGLHPPTSLVQYLLDQRTKFEKEEKKIPNYQWIQLYPEVLFRADVHIKETYLASYEKTDLKDYKEFTDRISTIFTCLFDSVDGDQKVKVVNLSRLESGEVLAKLEITSQYNPDDRKIRSALEVPVTRGNVDASLETIPDGFTFAKQGVSDTYRMEINLTKVNAAALAQKDTKEFQIMAKRLERVLLFLFDTVPGTQSVEVEEFRCLTSDSATAICKLTSEKHKDDKKLEEAISIPTLEGRLGKTLKTTCTPHGFSFKDVIVFEAEINVKEKFSKTLENSNSNDFKAFANKVQPIIKGLYNSETGEQDVEIVKCRQGSSDTVLVLYHLISHGNNDEEGLRAVTERKIRTGSLSLSYGITDDGFNFETNKCMFEVTLRLAEKYSDSKELANPKSDAFKSLKEKVQPEILRLYDSVCGSQEIDILRYKIESSGAVHSIIFKLTSSGCSDESTLKEPVEKQIQTGLLGSSLKVCATDLHFQKLIEAVFYQVTLNVKKTFTDELKKKHSAEYLAFSKFVQTVLRTQYDKVPGKQEFNVIECQKGLSGTNSTVVIIDVISKDCTNNVYMQLCQPVKNLITLGKLELALTTSLEAFSFRIIRGSKPVSSECFDLSLLITLLRKDSNVKPPKNGYDVLPSKDDISDGAQIATIKHYRNELAHASDAKMDEHEFDSLWSNLENAVWILGKDDKFMKVVDDASTMKLDSSTEEVLIRMVQHARQVLQLEEDVTELYKKIEKLTKQTEEQSASSQVEISEIKEEIGEKEEQILENKANIQNLYTELHRIEKKFDEKFRVQDEINVKQDEKNRNMESGIENNRRNIGKRDSYSMDLKSRTEQVEITLPDSFIEIEEVTKGADALKDNDIVILVGIKGSGKSTIGKAIIKRYCEVNTDYDMIQLSTTTESDINYCNGLGFFHSSNQVVVFLDDLFGRVPSTYAFKEHLMLLKWVYEKQSGIKILSTVQADTKACVEKLFTSDILLSTTEIIKLDSKIYPKLDMLRGSGIDGERAAYHIKEMVRTEEKQIGFVALFFLFQKNTSLWNELFTNPKEAFMKYLSNLSKEGDIENNMYYVILTQVCMAVEVHAKISHSEKKSMCKIAEVLLFNKKLDFENDVYTKRIMAKKSKADGILMMKKDPKYSDVQYCLQQEVTRDFIFQNYTKKAQGIGKILTTCSLNCIVSYFRLFTDTGDESFVCIDSSLHEELAIHITSIIQENLNTSVPDAIKSVKILCMSPLLQDENFLELLMKKGDQLSISKIAQTGNLRLGYDKIGSFKSFHFSSLLLYQSCRQLSMMYGENVKVVKTIFQKVCDSREEKVEISHDSREEREEKVKISQTIDELVRFSMEELCKENIDKNVVLELLWKFIMDKKIDCKYNIFLMNAWRNMCSQTIIWLRKNVIEPNCLQMEKCFINICLIPDVDKADWFLQNVPQNQTEKNQFNLYGVFEEALNRNSESLMKVIWKWEDKILKEYRLPDEDIANSKKRIANMVMDIVLKEKKIRSHSEIFTWATDTFTPRSNYFDDDMILDIEEYEQKYVTTKFTFT